MHSWDLAASCTVLGFPPVQSAFAMVRYGILGFGLHAVKRVMPGFALATKSQVTALSRRELGKAQASARQFNIPLAFDSAEALCRSSEVDAVFVCSPNFL